MENAKSELPDGVQLCHDQYDALLLADALVIATEWNTFRSPDFNVMRKFMNQPVIFDGRNVFSREVMQDQGFFYRSMGRTAVLGEAYEMAYQLS